MIPVQPIYPAERPAGAPVSRTIAQGDGWLVGEYVCRLGPRDPSFEERHECFAISAVVEGSFFYRGGTGAAMLYPGALLLGNAGACFECGHAHGSGDRCLAFHYDPAWFEEIAAAAAGSYRFRFPAAILPARRGLTPSVVRIENAVQRGGADVLEQLAVDLAETVVATISGTGTSARAPTPRDERRIGRAIRHIEAYADQPLDLAQLAEMARMSKYHFLRTFRRVTGVTPHQFLLTLRLRRAAMRLSNSALPVATVAYEAGFGDLSTFNSHFRQVFGTNPSAFRRAGRGR